MHRQWQLAAQPLIVGDVTVVNEKPVAVAKRVAIGLLYRGSGAGGESPLLSPPGFRAGCCVPDSVDLADHRVVGVPACRSVLGGRQVAQGRMTVPGVTRWIPHRVLDAR